MKEGLLYLNVYLASGRALVKSLIKEGKAKKNANSVGSGRNSELTTSWGPLAGTLGNGQRKVRHFLCDFVWFDFLNNARFILVRYRRLGSGFCTHGVAWYRSLLRRL